MSVYNGADHATLFERQARRWEQVERERVPPDDEGFSRRRHWCDLCLGYDDDPHDHIDDSPEGQIYKRDRPRGDY